MFSTVGFAGTSLLSLTAFLYLSRRFQALNAVQTAFTLHSRFRTIHFAAPDSPDRLENLFHRLFVGVRRVLSHSIHQFDEVLLAVELTIVDLVLVAVDHVHQKRLLLVDHIVADERNVLDVLSVRRVDDGRPRCPHRHTRNRLHFGNYRQRIRTTST